MSKNLDTEKLSDLLRSKRGSRGLRLIATEIGGVSASTLSRIEQGNLPDIETFLKICSWLEVAPDFFTKTELTKTDSKNQVIAHLRADRTLPVDTAEALIQMINLAYESADKYIKKK
ncbi:helix-turn-helix domain-containing protein [Pedobacter borealis]|uniref:helix-turn-helix domain-containing protein n=1 Tax=Pedobacter borealis TaxID=475254 RepID=UPI00049344FF|nr:helix-turn-helix transcriptional regulator [Pedobacter borealis]